MKLRSYYLILILFILVSLNTSYDALLHAQPTIEIFSDSSKLKVFIDCHACDFSFLRHEIVFVDFVRDPEFADVHILIPGRDTASGGRHFDIKFTGRKRYSNFHYNLNYISLQSDTEEARRRGITDMIKLGLMPFIAYTTQAELVEIQFDSMQITSEQSDTPDPWDYWIFNLDVSGGLSSDENRNSFEIRTAVDADRITREWRLQNRISYEFEEENFEDNGEHILSNLRQWELNSRAVRSLSSRWSAGLFTNMLSTTFENLQFSFDLAPAIEYNFFPWNESDHREITVACYMGLKYFRYFEQTLFDKYEENVFFSSMKIEFNFIQLWGELELDFDAIYYPGLKNKYRLIFENDLSVRISGGLSFLIEMNAERINDQIYLPKGDASIEEILLKRKQLATDYEFSLNLGLRFTFGSIYNNIVNRRL